MNNWNKLCEAVGVKVICEYYDNYLEPTSDKTLALEEMVMNKTGLSLTMGKTEAEYIQD